MAAGFASALLDELMGRNRDVNPAERTKTHWSDPDVCKSFLCAFCPNDLFTNTRSNLGRCDKIHDEDFRASYQKSARFEKMGYERDFTKYLESLIAEVDKKICRGQQRLILNSQPNPGPSTPQAAARLRRIEFLTERINQLVEEAETLGCDGNVDQAQSVMVMCESMRDERTTLTAINEAELKAEQDPSKSMEVCAVCGALLVQADLQLRPKDHIMGKQHMGYARIRAYIDSRRTTTGNGNSGTTLGDDAGRPESNNGSLLPGETSSFSDPRRDRYGGEERYWGEEGGRRDRWEGEGGSRRDRYGEGEGSRRDRDRGSGGADDSRGSRRRSRSSSRGRSRSPSDRKRRHDGQRRSNNEESRSGRSTNEESRSGRDSTSSSNRTDNNSSSSIYRTSSSSNMCAAGRDSSTSYPSRDD